MVSYVKYRDITAVIAAGTTLTTLGSAFYAKTSAMAGTVSPDQDGNLPKGAVSSGGTIRQAYTALLTGNDEYAKEFKKTYTQPGKDGPRDEVLLSSATSVAFYAKDVGPNVVKVATTMLEQDAATAASFARASQDQA